MKPKVIMVEIVLLCAMLARAQTGEPPRPPMLPPGATALFQAPQALTGEWWKNPEVATELRLSEAQKKQLDQVSMNTKLALIDAGANGLKAFVRLQSLLDADPVDEAAYNQQLEQINAAASKLVKDLGQMALVVRRTLTAEQWRKLEAMRAEHRFRPRPMGTARPGGSTGPQGQ